jgi:Leucine-rich repeat (LRR) protein
MSIAVSATQRWDELMIDAKNLFRCGLLVAFAANLAYAQENRAIPVLRRAGADIRMENGNAVRLALPERFDRNLMELISDLTDVREVHVMYCKTFTNADMAFLRSMTKLERLYLPNEISDEGFRHLAPLKKLQLLRLHNGTMTDAGLAVLKDKTEMRELSLWRCRRLTGNGLKYLAGMKRLKHLDLRRCDAVTDEGLPFLAGHTQLEVLDMSVMPRFTDRGFRQLKRLTKLRRLGITRTGIRDLSIIAGFKQLESLNVPKEIDESQLGHIAGLTKMQRLSLEVCHVTDKGLANLRNLKQIEWLDVHKTRISDRGIETLKTLPRLRYVHLSDTLVTAEGVDDLRRELPQCEIVR